MNNYGDISEEELIEAFHKADMVVDGKMDMDKFNPIWDKVHAKLSHPVCK